MGEKIAKAKRVIRTMFDDFSEYALHENLIHEWYQYFLLNSKYKKYCIAKRDNSKEGKERCLAIETDDIKNLYKDWGDIHDASFSFEDWLDSNAHLFGLKSIRLADAASLASEDAVCIEVPLGLDRERAIELMKDFIDENLEYFIGDEVRYMVNIPPNMSLKEMCLKIERAHAVLELRDDDGEGPITSGEIVRIIKRSSELMDMLGLDWSPGSKNNHVTEINRLIEFHGKCIESTIKGVFPYVEYTKNKKEK